MKAIRFCLLCSIGLMTSPISIAQAAPSTTDSVEISFFVALYGGVIFLVFYIWRSMIRKKVPSFRSTDVTPKYDLRDSSRIFLSYRRQDSGDICGRLYDSLVTKYGADFLYKDVDSTKLGLDFEEQIKSHLSHCDLALVLIGPDWMGVQSDGSRRIDSDNDFVRLEVRELLLRGIPVVPIFVRGAIMPDKKELPSDISEITKRNGLHLRPDPDFHTDLMRLKSAIDGIVS